MQIIFNILKTHTWQFQALALLLLRKPLKSYKTSKNVKPQKSQRDFSFKHGKIFNAQKLNDNFTLVHQHLNDITQTLQQRPDCLQQFSPGMQANAQYINSTFIKCCIEVCHQCFVIQSFVQSANSHHSSGEEGYIILLHGLEDNEYSTNQLTWVPPVSCHSPCRTTVVL